MYDSSTLLPERNADVVKAILGKAAIHMQHAASGKQQRFVQDIGLVGIHIRCSIRLLRIPTVATFVKLAQQRRRQIHILSYPKHYKRLRRQAAPTDTD